MAKKTKKNANQEEVVEQPATVGEVDVPDEGMKPWLRTTVKVITGGVYGFGVFALVMFTALFLVPLSFEFTANARAFNFEGLSIQEVIAYWIAPSVTLMLVEITGLVFLIRYLYGARAKFLGKIEALANKEKK